MPHMFSIPAPPASEQELLARATLLQGRTLKQLAELLELPLPRSEQRNKGLAGQMLERWLGSNAGNQAGPDFPQLGVELKSLPINTNGKPAESTFVSMVPLKPRAPLDWASCSVRKKLQRVLWIPVEAAGEQDNFATRHIGSPILWSPQPRLERQLQADWEELSELICLGRLEDLSAEMGTWLQVRPKGVGARSLARGSDPNGISIQTLPRGFYLRARCTERWVLRR